MASFAQPVRLASFELAHVFDVNRRALLFGCQEEAEGLQLRTRRELGE